MRPRPRWTIDHFVALHRGGMKDGDTFVKDMGGGEEGVLKGGVLVFGP